MWLDMYTTDTYFYTHHIHRSVKAAANSNFLYTGIKKMITAIKNSDNVYQWYVFAFCVAIAVMMTAFMNQLLKTHSLRMIAFSMSSESENYFLFVCCNQLFFAHNYRIVNTQISWYVGSNGYFIYVMITRCVKY